MSTVTKRELARQVAAHATCSHAQAQEAVDALFTGLREQLIEGHRTKFRNRFIRPLLDAGWLTMTIPDKPRSSKQRYVITEKGTQILQAFHQEQQEGKQE